MNRLSVDAACEACKADDIEALSHIVPKVIPKKTRVESIQIDDQPYSNVPLLCIAAAYGSEKCFKYLLANGEQTYYTDLFDNSPLHYAARYNQPGMVRAIIGYGNDPNAQTVSFSLIESFFDVY